MIESLALMTPAGLITQYAPARRAGPAAARPPATAGRPTLPGNPQLPGIAPVLPGARKAYRFSARFSAEMIM